MKDDDARCADCGIQRAIIIDKDEGALSKHIFEPVSLPCGGMMENRLVKVAMYEHLSTLFGGPPNTAHFDLYSRWSKGGWGMIITGNVQISRRHLTLGRDMIVPESLTPENLEPFRRLASIIHGETQSRADDMSNDTAGGRKPLAIMQLSHAGRQSPNILGGRLPFAKPMAPSAIPVGRAGIASTISLSYILHAIFFQVPHPMSESDIKEVVDAFVQGALLAARSGFDGVELHAAHGYLISQFISPKTNQREDAYSASDCPLHFLHRIVSSIRLSGLLSETFVVGVKLNAGDYTSLRSTESNSSNTHDEEQEKRALQHVQEIANWRMFDFIEISGGDYESPNFLSTNRSERQALFTRFSQKVMQTLDSESPAASGIPPSNARIHRCQPLVLLTGGLRSVSLLSSALARRHADLLGIGRLSVLHPELPRMMSSCVEEGQKGPCSSFPAELLELDHSDPYVHWPLQRLMALLLGLWAMLRIDLPKLVGAGANMARYIIMMRNIMAGQDPESSICGWEAVLRMWLWVAPSSYRWSSSCGRVWKSWLAVSLIGVIIGGVLGGVITTNIW
ncbi:hypothetical protein AcV7_002517 [Taiwanofungus camphoratus]|nr:hypothetical protein AcV7_002517 [Antrodia cinnamomea]